MANVEFFFEKKTREAITKSNKAYRFIYGLILLVAGIIVISKQEHLLSSKYSFIGWGMILMGFSFVLYGLIGKKIFASIFLITINEDYIKIKTSLWTSTTIAFNSITHIRFLPLSLELSFTDYSKAYNFSLLTRDEFESIKEKLTEYCVKKNIETEQTLE